MDEKPTPTDDRPTSPWIAATACCALVLIAGVTSLAALRTNILTRVDADAARTRSTIAQLQNRIGSLETQLAAVAQSSRPDTASIDALKTGLSTTDTQMTDLAARVETLEKKPAPAPVAPAAPVASLPAPASNSYASLYSAVLSGAPFTNELQAWQRDHPLAPEPVATLAPLAVTGIPTEDTLRTQLHDILATQPAAKQADNESDLIHRLNTHLEGLVSIKKQSDRGPYSALRNHASTEDINGLERDIHQLPEASQAPFAAWLKSAQARETAIASLHGLATIEPKAAVGQ